MSEIYVEKGMLTNRCLPQTPIRYLHQPGFLIFQMLSKNCRSPQLSSSKPEDHKCGLSHAGGGSPYSYDSHPAVKETRTSAPLCEDGISKATCIINHAKLMFPGLWCMHHSESRILLALAKGHPSPCITLHFSQGGTSW